MEGPLTAQRVNRGLAWVSLGAGMVAVLDATAMWLVLRFWISPAEYGVASLVATLFPILDLLMDMGLTSAIIQRDQLSRAAVSTVFWLNLTLSLVLAGLLFPAGRALAAFHGHAVLAWMLPAYGARLVFQNSFMIPQALLRRELRYKEVSIVRVLANLAEFLAKVGFAAFGFGVWMFVLAPLSRILVQAVGTQICYPWRPQLVLRWREAREYIAFGLKTSASQILFFVYTNVDYQVVGKLFGAAALGYYRWAYELILEPVRMISGVSVEIAFPTFARLRTKRDELAAQLVSFTRQNLVVILAFLAPVVLCADDILVVLVGPRWAGAATAARILCGVGVLRALSFILPPLLDGIGRPSLTLLYMGVAATLLPAAYLLFGLFLGPSLGYLSVAVAWTAAYPIAFAVLLFLALGCLELPLGVYLARVAGIPACAAAATLAGLGVRALLASAPAAVRLGVVTVATLAIFGILLAYLQGISPRAVVRALRSR